MTKITLDRETFKALASDTRLDILKTLDGKHMGLNEIAKATNLNKATLHEHLTKLNDAGLIKRAEREGHKWVYYRLTWKGESLLHPENTRIVVLFSVTFVALAVGILNFVSYIKGSLVSTFGNQAYSATEKGITISNDGMNGTAVPSMDQIFDNTTGLNRSDTAYVLFSKDGGAVNVFLQDPLLLYIALACFAVFTIILCFALWRYWENRALRI